MQLYWPHNLTTSGLASFSICSWHFLKKTFRSIDLRPDRSLTQHDEIDRDMSRLTAYQPCQTWSHKIQIPVSTCSSRLSFASLHSRKGAMFIFQKFLILSARLFWLGAAQKCYWPDKSIAEELASCNSMAENSHFCGANSLCLDNGISYSFNQGNKYGNRIWHGGCTDKSRDSDACPQYFQPSGVRAEPLGISDITQLSQMAVSQSLWSQRMRTTANSAAALDTTAPHNYALQIRLATVSALSTGNTTTAAVPPSSQGSYVNIGIAMGAGVGAAVGVLLVSAAMIFLCRIRKPQARQSFQKFDSKNNYPPTPQEYIEHVELEHSPRQFQGLGIQELEGR
ncbi:hypothetical protein D6D01_06192 [Aureobasidium pullulans]|uniref:Mid2 domain-containing protein n=1 Tax=Aureobasidium pullulans TaxID=5580 RepID=A0A4S9L2M2_AURPU|nr:hypothetical protein D6D01_06192 [Aureobasidium pullulans]